MTWRNPPKWPYSRTDKVTVSGTRLILSNGIQLASMISREKNLGNLIPDSRLVECDRGPYGYLRIYEWGDIEDWLKNHNVEVIGPAIVGAKELSNPAAYEANVSMAADRDRAIAQRDNAIRERNEAITTLNKLRDIIKSSGYGMLTLMEIIQCSVPVDGIINCGIYFLIYKSEIVYVGQSVDITSRIRNHISDTTKRFDRISFHKCDKKDLNRLEISYIRMLSPKYNVQHKSSDLSIFDFLNNPEIFANG